MGRCGSQNHGVSSDGALIKLGQALGHREGAKPKIVLGGRHWRIKVLANLKRELKVMAK